MRSRKKWLIGACLAMGTPVSAQPFPAEISNIPVACLVDLSSGKTLFGRACDLRFVPASLVKVMTAKVAIAELRSGRLRPDTVFKVDTAIAREWNGKGTSLYLKAGDKVSVDTLIRAITTVSANDAAIVLAEGAAGSVKGWSAWMNAEARRLGMRDSHFATPNGWPDNGKTYVSAHDLVKLASALIGENEAEYRRYFGHRSMTYNSLTQSNRDPLLGVVKGTDGIKTGHTAEAGYNFLGAAERAGRRLVMVVAGAHSTQERAVASRVLLEWGFAAWQSRALFKAHTPLAEARVQGGDARKVALSARFPVHAAYPQGSHPGISLTIRYAGPLHAPIAKGAQVAEMVIDTGDGAPGRVPLYALRNVGRAGVMDRLINGLYGLFT